MNVGVRRRSSANTKFYTYEMGFQTHDKTHKITPHDATYGMLNIIPGTS